MLSKIFSLRIRFISDSEKGQDTNYLLIPIKQKSLDLQRTRRNIWY